MNQPTMKRTRFSEEQIRRDGNDDEDDASAWSGSMRSAGQVSCTVRALGSPGLHRCFAMRWLDGTMGHQPADEPENLRDL